MKRATLTETTTAAVEQLLLNLEMNEMCIIETVFGTITVQRIYHGAEAWLTSSSISERELGVRCKTPLDAFAHQLEVGKRHAAENSTKKDEAAIEAEIVSAMTPLTYALIFAAALKFSARLPLVSIISANFDKTLFATQTSGTLNVQTFYYPADPIRCSARATACGSATLLPFVSISPPSPARTYSLQPLILRRWQLKGIPLRLG